MGFNNGYDSGYSDALMDVRSGRVAGLGPTAETPRGGGTAFDAGVLEGYDVEKLLSISDVDAYLAALTDTDLANLVDTNTSLISPKWRTIKENMDLISSKSKLAIILHKVLSRLDYAGVIEASE